MSKSRYETLFQRLDHADEIAFIPFTVLGDPNRQMSADILRAMLEGGADALELGIPFSDPVADGPVIQAADARAIHSGITWKIALEIVAELRKTDDSVPIGLLVYSNLVISAGIDSFYHAARKAGIDSILIADVPTLEAGPFVEAAKSVGLHQVFIAPPNVDETRLGMISEYGGGYTYIVTRRGVTGADNEASFDVDSLLDQLKVLGAPPPVYGFGISRPDHIRAAKQAGAAGAISGSALVRLIEQNADDRKNMLQEIRSFVNKMKAATRGRSGI
jgi:tryptophan synthase alpha chain